MRRFKVLALLTLLVIGLSIFFFNFSISPNSVVHAQTPPVTTMTPSGTLGNNGWYTSYVTVTLSATASAGVRYIGYGINIYPYYLPYTAPFLVTTQGLNNVSYFAIDNNMVQETQKISTVKIDLNPPVGSISINDGAASTSTTSVTLKLSASDATSGVSQMRFSNDNIAYAAWKPYTTSDSWTLQGGYGTKTVYVQFRDNAGLVSTYSDTITLSMPLTASAAPNSTTVTTGQSATFTATVSGGTSPYTYQWYEGTNVLSGQTSATLTISKSTAGTYTYYCKVTDSGGQTANSNTVTLTVLPSTSPSQPPPTTPPPTTPPPTATKEGTPLWIIAGATAVLGAVSAVIFFKLLKRRRKPPALARYPQSPPTDSSIMLFADDKVL